MYSKKKNFAIVEGIYKSGRNDVSYHGRLAPVMITHLARPKGDDGAEGVAGLRLQSAHLAEGSEHGDGEGTGRARLDLDLGHLQRAKGDVGEELSRSRARQPDRTLVLAGGLLASHVHVEVLEVLVETVLEETLEGVANEGGAETLPETLATLLREDGAETGEETLVLARVHLDVHAY